MCRQKKKLLDNFNFLDILYSPVHAFAYGKQRVLYGKEKQTKKGHPLLVALHRFEVGVRLACALLMLCFFGGI